MNSIPLIDLKKQYESIKDEVDQAIQQVLCGCRFIMGPEVKEFEEAMAKYLDVKYAVGVASGTDALEVGLLSLGIGDGDEVITTPFTFIATTEAIVSTGAKPVFVDIDEKTYCLDCNLIEAKITKQTKAIMPVHLYGHPADMDKITALAEKHNLKVIEDCAQSLGAAFSGKKVGTIGNAGCLSFFPGKNLGCYGDGGMVVTNDEQAAQMARMLRQHGSNKKYYHAVNGFNSRLDTLQAAVLKIKLKYLDKWNDLRRKNAALYADLINKSAKKGSIIPAQVEPSVVHSFNYYTIRLQDRDAAQQRLKAAGIGSMIYYPLCLHQQEVYKDLGYKPGDFPKAEKAQNEVLSLPMFAELSAEQINEVVKVLVQ
ncbi:MAG: DegT/DnrJ/EryC1/StrS family aminotransferase [Candidatus Margulisbacteria bacterium]|nr:DegT/DnrJ/EryC1/StrS family aminotransferase [Candidatus Margulisiibacteriota bacterium]